MGTCLETLALKATLCSGLQTVACSHRAQLRRWWHLEESSTIELTSMESSMWNIIKREKERNAPFLSPSRSFQVFISWSERQKKREGKLYNTKDEKTEVKEGVRSKKPKRKRNNPKKADGFSPTGQNEKLSLTPVAFLQERGQKTLSIIFSFVRLPPENRSPKFWRNRIEIPQAAASWHRTTKSMWQGRCDEVARRNKWRWLMDMSPHVEVVCSLSCAIMLCAAAVAVIIV